jgi:hypothetical protein
VAACAACAAAAEAAAAAAVAAAAAASAAAAAPAAAAPRVLVRNLTCFSLKIFGSFCSPARVVTAACMIGDAIEQEVSNF